MWNHLFQPCLILALQLAVAHCSVCDSCANKQRCRYADVASSTLWHHDENLNERAVLMKPLGPLSSKAGLYTL